MAERVAAKPTLNDADIEKLVSAVSNYFNHRYVDISLKGVPLNKGLQEDVKILRIIKPDKIRVLALPDQEFQKKYSLHSIPALAPYLDLSTANIDGVTYKHAIAIKESRLQDKDYWARLLRFIAYFECYGSTKGFLNIYLRYLILFGWNDHPFARDSAHSSLIFEQKRRTIK